MVSHQSTSQKKGKFSLYECATDLTLLSFHVCTHYWELTYQVFAWKILDKPQRTEVTHKVLQIQLGLGILPRDGSKSYKVRAKIQDLHVWISELWNNRWTTLLFSEDAHGLLSWSPTPGCVPWLLISTQQRAQRSLPLPSVIHHRPVFSTRISDLHFPPQCMLFRVVHLH